MKPITDIRVIRERGFEALIKTLGPGGAIRFLQQYGNGKGDYTAERAELLKGETIESIVRQIRKKRRAVVRTPKQANGKETRTRRKAA